MMMVVVSYDVATGDGDGRRRLRRVAKKCQDFGQRVQNSVFECVVDAAQWAGLRHDLLAIVKPEEDSLRFYFLGGGWKSHVEHFGTKKVRDLDEALLL